MGNKTRQRSIMVHWAHWLIAVEIDTMELETFARPQLTTSHVACGEAHPHMPVCPLERLPIAQLIRAHDVDPDLRWLRVQMPQDVASSWVLELVVVVVYNRIPAIRSWH